MIMPHFTFKKEERLSSKKLIDELFKSGSSFYLQPFKIFFAPPDPEYPGVTGLNLPKGETSSASPAPAQVLISVSKTNFKRAVDRNKIKRLIREAYRLNKKTLYGSLEKKNRHLIIAILYTSKKIEPFSSIQQKLVAVLMRLAEDQHVAEKHPA
jgi:ribonuclease P protein component